MFVIRARLINFFWTDTDVLIFTLPITDADTDDFALLKQCQFCPMRQNKHSWSYFVFSQTWLL